MRNKKNIGNNFTAIWRLMNGFRLRYCSAILTQACSLACKSATYMLLSWFIDDWLMSTDHSLPVQMVAASFIFLATMEGFFSFMTGRLSGFTAENMALRLRNRLLDQIQHLSFSWHDKTDTGDLIQRATTDIDSVRLFFSEQAIGIARVVFLYLINFILIFQINRNLALTTIIIVPLILVTAIFFFIRIGKIYMDYQNQDAIVYSTLQENLTGVRVVKAFARQDYEIDKYERVNHARLEIGRKLAVTESFFWPASDVLCGTQIVFSYLLGAKYAMDGTISLGNYVAFQALVTFIVWPMRNLGRMIVRMSRSLVSFGRLEEVLNTQREPLGCASNYSKKPPVGRFVFDKVDFSYDGENKVLSDISFVAEPGQVVAIIGSTGAGKTSLLNLLPAFYAYTNGSITLDGTELNEIPREYLRKYIGIVEQEPFLFSRTLRENIAFGLERIPQEEEIISAAKSAAIHETIMTFEKGYDTIIGERGVTLSGGQKQRIAIARALLRNPEILIMDDSLSAVDTETEAQIQTALDHLMKKRTTFLVGHRVQSIMNADLILVMDKGKIIQSGNHNDLIKQDGMYKEIYTVQTQIEMELQKEIGAHV